MLATVDEMSDLSIPPLAKPFSATFTPPGSKSLTNRAMVLAALGEGISELKNCLFADDTLVMIDSLVRLGFWTDVDRGSSSVRIHGRGGKVPASSAELFCGNSGTTLRFLAAVCGLGRGPYVLDGVGRMRQRPVGQLVDLLRNYAVRVEYLMEEGFPPIQVHGEGLAGGIARFGRAQSSQFLSALLMVCPCARHEARIDLEEGQTSWPYVAMTMQLMDEFGVMAELERDPKSGQPRRIVVPRSAYKPAIYSIEPDASAASYFLALAAMHDGAKVTIQGLGRRSKQGDVGFADVLHRMGAGLVFGPDFITVMGGKELEGIEIDMSDMPDAAMTLAVVALFARGQSRIKGLHTLRHKETDRLAALATELRKLGAEVEIEEDALVIDPPDRPHGAEIETYDDHRMAMSFALAGTKVGGVRIRDAQCVNKTYPGYFEDLSRLTTGSAQQESTRH
jgi:3-phosphoshikimate 1-carboxyvinyltransferase